MVFFVTGFTGDRCKDVPDFCQKQDPCPTGICYNNYDTFAYMCKCEDPYRNGEKQILVISKTYARMFLSADVQIYYWNLIQLNSTFKTSIKYNFIYNFLVLFLYF
jgi:hypothetical protein